MPSNVQIDNFTQINKYIERGYLRKYDEKSRIRYHWEVKVQFSMSSPQPDNLLLSVIQGKNNNAESSGQCFVNGDSLPQAATDY
jgi:hypothetical protein